MRSATFYGVLDALAAVQEWEKQAAAETAAQTTAYAGIVAAVDKVLGTVK
jgi:hypothetical protein